MPANIYAEIAIRMLAVNPPKKCETRPAKHRLARLSLFLSFCLSLFGLLCFHTVIHGFECLFFSFLLCNQILYLTHMGGEKQKGAERTRVLSCVLSCASSLLCHISKKNSCQFWSAIFTLKMRKCPQIFTQKSPYLNRCRQNDAFFCQSCPTDRSSPSVSNNCIINHSAQKKTQHERESIWPTYSFRNVWHTERKCVSECEQPAECTTICAVLQGNSEFCVDIDRLTILMADHLACHQIVGILCTKNARNWNGTPRRTRGHHGNSAGNQGFLKKNGHKQIKGRGG